MEYFGCCFVRGQKILILAVINYFLLFFYVLWHNQLRRQSYVLVLVLVLQSAPTQICVDHKQRLTLTVTVMWILWTSVMSNWQQTQRLRTNSLKIYIYGPGGIILKNFIFEIIIHLIDVLSQLHQVSLIQLFPKRHLHLFLQGHNSQT